MRGIALQVDGADRARRRDRVWCTVHAAQRLANPRDPFGIVARRQLRESSGLSPEGVELALSRHLETDPHPADVERLVRDAPTARRCWVVLAANVCTAPLRAIACATAAAPEVQVRPSRRDPVVASLLIRALTASHRFARAGGWVEQAQQPAVQVGDEVHLYGSDAALQTIAATLPVGATVRRHGTGIGVAVIERGRPLHEAARATAEDVVAFDQRGCLSPRFVLVDGPADRAERFAATLHQALQRLGRRVPRGPLDAAMSGALQRYRATAEALGPCHQGEGHLVAVDPAPQALLLPPTARCVLVTPAEPRDVERLLTPWRRYVVAVGGIAPSGAGRLAERLLELQPAARRSDLGAMQRPPLDGPVDLRPAAATGAAPAPHPVTASAASAPAAERTGGPGTT